MMEYISLLNQVTGLEKNELRQTATSVQFPWSNRVKNICKNIHKYHPDHACSDEALILNHCIRDVSLLKFNKSFLDEAIKSVELKSVAQFSSTTRPVVILGTHDYTQMITAYVISQIKKGLHVFAEDASAVDASLSPIFQRCYAEFSEPNIGGTVIQTNGGVSPRALMEQCARGGKSVYAIIDIFANTFKNVVEVEGDKGRYRLVVGLIDFYLDNGYEFYFSRSVIGQNSDMILHIEPLVGQTVMDIAGSYVERLEYYNNIDPLGWEGYCSPSAIQ